MKNILKLILLPSKNSHAARHVSYGHWIAQRTSAIFLLFILAFSLFLAVFSLGAAPPYPSPFFYCSIAGLSVAVKHFIDGIENVILDYVHDSKLILLSSVFLKCVGAFLIKYVYFFFLLLQVVL